MGDLYAGLLAWVQAHGMFGVFLFMFLENMAIPFPTELGFITAQGLIAAGYSPYWYGFTVITAGHLLGAGVTYYAGRMGHNALVRRFGHSPMMMRVREIMQRWYSKYGPLAILFGRLVGQVRPWSSLAAGMGQVPQVRFWLWTVLGALLYTAVAMWVTAWGWAWTVKYPQWRVPAIIVVLTIFYGVVASGLVVKLVQRWRTRRRLAREQAE